MRLKYGQVKIETFCFMLLLCTYEYQQIMSSEIAAHELCNGVKYIQTKQENSNWLFVSRPVIVAVSGWGA